MNKPPIPDETLLPPRVAIVPLKEEHINALYVSGWGAYCSRASFIAIFREAERVHGIGKQEGK
jgi:hypothetical protein